MTIVFRTDASTQIGSGHIMRCMTLADGLKKQGCDVLFVCRELRGHLCQFLENNGFAVKRLPEPEAIQIPVAENSTDHRPWLGTSWEVDAQETIDVLQQIDSVRWLVVDHYALDEKWEAMMSGTAEKIMVIDDLADRRHQCNVLLDQNHYAALEKRYASLIPEDSQRLLGPRFALLRKEFQDLRGRLSRCDGPVRKILVFFGGVDATNETMKTLRAISNLDLQGISIDVIIGAGNLHKKEVEAACKRIKDTQLHCQISNMAQMMADADLSIGGAGASTWERCSLRLPSIMIALAHNQIAIAEGVHSLGAACYLGSSEIVTEQMISDCLSSLLTDSEVRHEMSAASADLVDCQGVERVVETVVMS